MSVGEAQSMLNQNERRRLEAIERQLEDDDPEFARRFSHWSPQGATARTSRLLLVLVFVVGALGVLLSLAASSPALFLGSVALTAVGWFWYHRRKRGGAGSSSGD